MPSIGGSKSSEVVISPARRRAIIERVLDKLPLGASSEERLRAIQEARKSVQELGPETTELEILQAATDAVLLVASDCERRLRKKRVLSNLWVYLPWGATEEEKAEAEEIVCDLLEDLPPIPESELEAGIRRELGPIKRRIERRGSKEHLVEHGRRYVSTFLSELHREESISREEWLDFSLQRELEETVAEELRQELDGSETTDDVEDIVRDIAAGELDLAPAEEDNEEEDEE
ncbi:hypothetical protein MYX77_03315 [Acidobacteriia bacterium AH_259_A11_L15]|nr:hypothetical protein [Acidobacteriia bacterium AH_259_A11_L15]